MPYKDENDPKLPDRIKRLPDTRRRQWVNVWNNVYNRCSGRGGETTTCEAMAFRQANGVIAKETTMEKTEVVIDGIGVSLRGLLESLKLQGTRDKLKEDQAARAKKYGIKVQAGAPLTMPARFARMGAKLDDLADRVNYRYPVWLTRPDRESLTPAQLAQVLNAPARFAQFATRYDQMSRAQVERRIDEARKKFGVGQPAKEGELEKSWDCLIFKRNEEKRIALSVALKASGGDNGIRPDSQRDILTAEEVEAAAYNFMLNSRQFDLHHKSVLPTSRAAVVESYLAPVDFTAGKTEVRKGDWIVGVHFADPVLWEKVKAGEINAFSIKGVGKRRPFQG